MSSRRHRSSKPKRRGAVPEPQSREGAPSRRGWNVWLVAVGMFVLALAARVAYLAQSADHPTFDTPIIDAGNYHEMAVKLARTGELDHRFFWQAPLYPILLAGVYKLVALCGQADFLGATGAHEFFGFSIWTAKLLQACIGAMTCELTWRLGRRFFGTVGGLIAGLAASLYAPMIFFDGELVATGLAAFWAVLIVHEMVMLANGGPVWRWATLGLIGGLSVITRPTFLPFLAVGWAYLLWRRWHRGDGPRPNRPVLLRAGAVAVGFVAVALPTMLTCHSVAGRASLLPSSGGVNFYIGNHPDRASMLRVRTGYYWQKLTREEPERAGATDNWSMQAYYRDKTLANFRKHPGAMAGNLVAKTAEMLSSRELPRNVDPYVYRSSSWLLSALMWRAGPWGFPFGVILPLAVIGLVSRWRDVPGCVKWFLLLYPAAVVLVFVSARYRVPIIPVLLIPAAGGVTWLVEQVRSQNRKQLLRAGACVVGVVLLSALPGPFVAERMNYEAEMHRAVGNQRMAKGEMQEATAFYRRAVSLDPNNPDAHLNLATMQLREGKFAEAEAGLRKTLAIDANREDATLLLGDVLLAQRRFDEALACYRRAFDMNDYFTEALWRLGETQLRLGRTAEATKTFDEYCRRYPGHPRATTKLTWLLATSLDDELRDGQRAVELGRLACELTAGENAAALDAYAAALAETGQYKDAVEVGQKAADWAAAKVGPDSARRIRARVELYRSGRSVAQAQAQAQGR